MTSERQVGPVFENTPFALALIQAVKLDNKDVAIVDRGSYLRVQVANRCLLRRATAEKTCGQTLRFPVDLEKVMPSFKGRFIVNDDEAVWLWE